MVGVSQEDGTVIHMLGNSGQISSRTRLVMLMLEDRGFMQRPPDARAVMKDALRQDIAAAEAASKDVEDAEIAAARRMLAEFQEQDPDLPIVSRGSTRQTGHDVDVSVDVTGSSAHRSERDDQ